MEVPDSLFAEKDVLLGPHTWYRVGGAADLVLSPRDTSECRRAVEWMARQSGPVLVLGGGTNVLICDEGFRGTVLMTRALKDMHGSGKDCFYVGAGVALERMVREVMLAHNYAGVGALAGIPGSVGGAIYMNAGTSNGSICNLLDSVDVVSDKGLRRLEVTSDMFDYRFQKVCSPEQVITGAVFRFEHSDKDQTAVFDHYCKRRLDKQPQGRCCGSVFKNPPGDHAGRLLEACGLKGERRGGAEVSRIHANFIMNVSNATFDDILGLMRLCRKRVMDQFGIWLEPEVKMIGESGLREL